MPHARPPRSVPLRAVLVCGAATAALIMAPFGGLAGPSAPPPSTPGQVFRVPYTLSATQHLMVRVRANGAGPLNLIVDTGAPALFLSPAAGEKAKVKVEADQWARVERLEIEGGAVLADVQARVQELPQLAGMNHLAAAGARLDGVLGYGILARFRMRIDLQQPYLTWTLLDWRPPEFQPLSAAESQEPPAEARAAMEKLEALPKLLGGLLPRRDPPVPLLRGFLGVELAASLQKEKGPGARVTRVLPGSPAAGKLWAGDRILAVRFPGERSMTPVDPAGAGRLMARLEPGRQIVLKVLRSRKVLQTPVVPTSEGF